MSTKLFIGNVPVTMTSDDLVHMFEPYGEIAECDIVKNYAFLHYTKPESANQAASALNGAKFENNALRVEVSHSKVHTAAGSAGPRPKSTKLFVGNLSATASVDELKKLFDTYGKVTECDIVRDFAFIHFEHEQEADLAADMLNGAEFAGNMISVERSRSKLRKDMTGAGDACFNCGKPGHFSRDCRSGAGADYGHGDMPGASRGRGIQRGYAPPPRPVYDLYDDYEDYYAYRARYGPPPPPDRYSRERLPPLPQRYRDYVDPYERPARSYRDPYERPPPYYYDIPERRERDPYEDRYRYAMRTRDEVPRRRAPPPY